MKKRRDVTDDERKEFRKTIAEGRIVPVVPKKRVKSRAAYEAKLDLHGFTLAVAFEALRKFIADCRKHELRRVLIVTGKSGALARDVPLWLEGGHLARFVEGYERAPVPLGGQGALLVKLQKAG